MLRNSLLVVSLALAGCAVAPADGDSADPTGKSKDPMSVTHYGWTLPYRGGSGGSMSLWDSCADQQVMVGIYGNKGTYENQLGIICAPLHADGTLGPEEWHWIMGGQQGSYSFVTHCPAGTAVSGLYGFSHTYLDLLGIRCDSPPFTGANVSYNVSGGASGGDWFFDMCPWGYGLRNLTLHFGSWIDGEQAQCAWIQPY